MKKNTDKEIKCSFCKKTNDYLMYYNYRITKAPNLDLYICDNCATKITLTSELSIGSLSSNLKRNMKKMDCILSPKDINSYLDEYIMHQKSAKRTLSISLYQHMKRVSGDYTSDDLDVSKSNVMIVGQSGTGKTFIIEKLAEIFSDIPFLCVNANSYTSEGYKGLSVSDMIRELYIISGYNIDSTESGVIFIDEIDKIAGFDKNEGVNTINVQQSLLKIIEGTIVQIEDLNVSINTRDILFICAGAFDSIENIVNKRLDVGSIGFSSKKHKSNTFDYSLITHNDIKKYGFIDEFLGRFPVLTSLETFNENQYYEMLTQPKNNLIDQIKLIFTEENSSVEFTENALLLLSKKASKLMLGARGAKTILIPLLEDSLFQISGNSKSYSVLVDSTDDDFFVTTQETN